MNEALVGNWSQTISKDDEVVFIGDLTVSSEFGVFKQWIEQLNGTVQFVLGNHDTYIMPNLDGLTVGEQYRFTYKDVSFFCIHNPANAPSNWDGWVLHGHHHNNWPEEYPFINYEERRVNVSVELINYTPLAVSDLLECILEGRRLHRLADANL
nr:metallophosphoesterase [Halobellus sp. ZY16]